MPLLPRERGKEKAEEDNREKLLVSDENRLSNACGKGREIVMRDGVNPRLVLGA